MKKGILAKILSIALAASMVIPSSIPMTVNAAEPNGVSTDNNIVDEVEGVDIIEDGPDSTDAVTKYMVNTSIAHEEESGEISKNNISVNDNIIEDDNEIPVEAQSDYKELVEALNNIEAPDLFELDIKNDSKETINEALFSNSDRNVAAWVSTLSDEDIQILLDKDTMLGDMYSIGNDICTKCGLTAGSVFDTALEYYQILAKCKHTNAKWGATSGKAYLNITHDGNVVETATCKCENINPDSSFSAKQPQGIKWSISSPNGYVTVNSACNKMCNGLSTDNYIYGWFHITLNKTYGWVFTGYTNTNCTGWWAPRKDIVEASNEITVKDNTSPYINTSQNGVESAMSTYLIANARHNFVGGNGTLNMNFTHATYNVVYHTNGPVNGKNATTGSNITRTYNATTGPKIESAANMGIKRICTVNFDTAGGSSVAAQTYEVPQAHWANNANNVGFTLGQDANACFNVVGNGGTYDLYPVWSTGSIQLPAAPSHAAYTMTYSTTGGSAIGATNATPTFAGWDKGVAGAIWSGINDNATVTAKWINPTITLPSSTRTGYQFNGWDKGAAGAKYTLNKNETATAKWTANTYTVKLDANGGTLSGSDTINAVYDKAFDLPIPEKAPTTVGSNANGEDEVTTTYSFNGWACPAGTFSGSAKNLTAVNGETVTMVAQWVEAKTTKQYISGSPTPPQEPDIVINQVDTEKLNDILKKIDSLKKIADLSADDLKNLKTVVASISGMDQSTASKLIDLISDSSALTDAQKLTLLKHLANGYLTDEDRLLLRTIVGSSALSTADKDKILKAISAFSYLSYDEQKKLLDALNAGSSATFKTGDGVEYIFTKGADGMLTVALKSLNGITDLVVPNSVTLAGTTFPVTKIAPNTFKGNTALKSVTIPGNVSEIGESAFEGCLGLEKVNTTNGLITIGDKAFKDCKSLTSFACPASLKTIGNSAFEGCTKLSTITLNEGLITIGNRAFYGCSALTKVVIPRTVLKIGSSAFEKCTKLKTVTFASYATAQCQTIGAKAFKGDKALTGIKLPKKVNKIQKSTFSGCKKLKSVKGMAGVTDIGASAFTNCKSLKSITLQKKLQTIGSKAFYGCKKLKTVNIKSKAVTKVGSKAFKKCKKGIGFKVPNKKIRSYTKLLKGKY